jgi:hypothetical protein
LTGGRQWPSACSTLVSRLIAYAVLGGLAVIQSRRALVPGANSVLAPLKSKLGPRTATC